MLKIFRNILIFVVLFLVRLETSRAQDNSLSNALDYYNQKIEAIENAYDGKWGEVQKSVKRLLEYNQDDSNIHYLLGVSSYNLKDYSEAITAFKSCLELGGASLKGISGGSALSNDMMIKVAEAYGHLGDKKNTIIWLEKGFEARYDEKPFIMGSEAFVEFMNDEDFLNLFGKTNQKDISRIEAWKQDIYYLQKEILRLNYKLSHGESKEVLSEGIENLVLILDQLSDEEIIVEVMEIFGSLGNGHNLVIPTSPKYGALKKLPLQLYYFTDGMYIVNASEEYEEWIGYKVKSIEGTPIEEALELTNSINARDNDMQTLWLGPYYLSLPDVLKGIGIINDPKVVTYTLVDKDDEIKEVEFVPEVWSFGGFPKLAKLKNQNQPKYLSQLDNPYWYEAQSDLNALYIQFNNFTNKSDQSLKAFCQEWVELIEKDKIENLIIDIRHNHGGNGSLSNSMHKAIRNFLANNSNDNFYVLAGRETFSAAQNFLTEITDYSDPIIVGEPSGSKPNHIGEAGWVMLPNSGLMCLTSSQFHQTSFAEDNRKWIAPDIPVKMSSDSYFNAKDPGLESIIEIIKNRK